VKPPESQAIIPPHGPHSSLSQTRYGLSLSLGSIYHQLLNHLSSHQVALLRGWQPVHLSTVYTAGHAPGSWEAVPSWRHRQLSTV
jgi:hypothetical protein